MCGDRCVCGTNYGAEDPEVQRLKRESTKSKPGETPGADKDDSPQPGTEGV